MDPNRSKLATKGTSIKPKTKILKLYNKNDIRDITMATRSILIKPTETVENRNSFMERGVTKILRKFRSQTSSRKATEMALCD